MAANRANLIAAVVVAVGVAGPALAQPAAVDGPSTDGPVNLLPPRPRPLPTMPVLPPFSGTRTGVQPTTFGPPATAGSPFAAMSGPQQRLPVGQPTSTPAPAWQTAAPIADPNAGRVPETPNWSSPTGGAQGNRTANTTPSYPAMHVQQQAPAWRWHGYGAANPGGAVAPSYPSTPPPPAPASATAALPAPPVPYANMDAPTAAAAIWPAPTPVASPAPLAPLPAAPMTPLPAMSPNQAIQYTPEMTTAAEPTWRAAGTSVAAAAVPQPVGGDPWTGPGGRAVALAAPTGAVTTARAVAETPATRTPGTGVQQVAFTQPHSPAASVQRTAVEPPPAAFPPVPPPAAPAMSGAERAALIRARVQQACQGRGRDLEIYARGPGSLLVRLKVGRAADAQYLAERISQVPELAPYHVVYEMRVAQ